MDFGVLIIGAGLSGSSLACALGGSGLRVGLVERQAPALAEDWDAELLLSIITRAEGLCVQ